MKSHISKVRIAALAVGLAIVMSSCGIQNQAGDSSSASGKTKNFALLADGRFCFDTPEEEQAAINAAHEAHDFHHTLGNPIDEDPNGPWWARNLALHGTIELSMDGQIGDCPATVSASSADVAAEAAFVCVTSDQKQAMIDGYKEQIAKTDYPADWSPATIADYQDQMKRGLANAEIICTSDK
jgi:hypothetical protein